MKKMAVGKCLVVILVLQVVLSVAQEVGESCVNNAGEEGTCKLYSECPEAEDQARRGVQIKLCGFYELTTPVVCCKARAKPSANASAPNELTIDENIAFPSEDQVPNLQGNSFFGGAAKKSEQKCLEYTKDVTDVVHAIPLVTNVEPISINVTKCEYNSVALIVGGAPASRAEFPFMAAVGFPDENGRPAWRCGGTLISDRWVLTAAHCTYAQDDPKWIRLGALELDQDQEVGRRDLLIKDIIAHPEYKYPRKYHDIALLQIDRKVEMTKYIRPACLNTKSTISQQVAVATGWGAIQYGSSNSNKLLKVQLNIYGNNVCSRVYEKDPGAKQQLPQGIIKSMLCVGELKGGMDTCLGDSGGPLFVTQKENMCKFYVIGVTSFGKLCAQENVPAIYTRVSEYVDWIEGIVWKN